MGHAVKGIPKADKPVFVFRDVTNDPQTYFEILSKDWQQELIPVWGEYEKGISIYLLQSGAEVLAGGLVFKIVSPDTEIYRETAQSWFDSGYLYFGYLWVPEKYRGMGFGSQWLSELRAEFPGKKFWLAVDEEPLRKFYIANGFKDFGKVPMDGIEEWILADP